MTEAEVRKIVKSVLSDEMDKIKTIKDDIAKIKKDALADVDIKKIVRKMMINQYKWMWQKSSTYINQI
jgi:hypothetical protein